MQPLADTLGIVLGVLILGSEGMHNGRGSL
jgi:hypothetical protein